MYDVQPNVELMLLPFESVSIIFSFSPNSNVLTNLSKVTKKLKKYAEALFTDVGNVSIKGPKETNHITAMFRNGYLEYKTLMPRVSYQIQPLIKIKQLNHSIWISSEYNFPLIILGGMERFENAQDCIDYLCNTPTVYTATFTKAMNCNKVGKHQIEEPSVTSGDFKDIFDLDSEEFEEIWGLRHGWLDLSIRQSQSKLSGIDFLDYLVNEERNFCVVIARTAKNDMKVFGFHKDEGNVEYANINIR